MAPNVENGSVEKYNNISCYHFTPMDDYKLLKGELHQALDGYKEKDLLRGTILLSSEGMNVNMSGTMDTLNVVMRKIRSLRPQLDDMYFKVTDGGTEHNYRKLRIRLKQEIVTLKRKDILDEEGKTKADKISPEDMQRLIDQGKDVVLLDVRNDYEQSVGHFKGCVKAPIRIFNDFPKWAKGWVDQDPTLKDKTVITYCTGGIKTEKATLTLRDVGIKNAKMLQGGILDYFKKVEQDKVKESWKGDCFVYDRRVAVRTDLSESDCVLCKNCTWPLTLEEQKRKEYIPPKQCHMCVGRPRGKKLTLRDIKDDPNAPKRPISAIQRFMDDHPDLDKKTLGIQWQQQLTKEEKKPYVDKFNESMQVYKSNVEKYLKKLEKQKNVNTANNE